MTSEFVKAASPLSHAIARAQANLLRLQHPDGHWRGELLVDSTLCSDFIAYMHWTRDVDAVLQEKCVAHIRRRQLADGGWNIYEGGPAEINATVKAYFALKLAGHAPTQPHMREARAAALRLGGVPAMNTYSKLYLALLGQYPWEHLPTVPPEMILFPRWCFFNIHELSSWSRAMLVPLAIINHFRPTRAAPAEHSLHELYPAGTERGELRTPWRRPRLSWPNFFLACDRMLKWLRWIGWRPLRKLALRRCEEWMTARMGEGSDGLAAIFPAMLNALIAIEALGYEKSHPLFQKARRDFEGLFVDDPRDFRIQPCLSPVWDTAIATIALAESSTAVPAVGPAGVSPGDTSGRMPAGPTGQDACATALARAVAWLESREVRTRGDWTVKNPAPEASGWAFEYRNDFFPDTDDTMMVLLALHAAQSTPNAQRPTPNVQSSPQPPARGERSSSVEESSQRPWTLDVGRWTLDVEKRSLAWLLSFQCRDGGWAAFDKDVTQRWLQDVPFADHNAILDPSCADLTGRVLELLGKIGHPRDDLRIRRALAFLRKTQERDGSWYGRWGVNYIYGTWQVLRGLCDIGEDMRQPWIVRARDWLASCQNEDGGWGETCASYDDPTQKGRGPSTPSQTAWAVMGLLAALEPEEHPEKKNIARGIAWLLEKQDTDGSWPEPATTGTGFPRVFYLKYDLYRNTWPLLALTEFRRKLPGASEADDEDRAMEPA